MPRVGIFFCEIFPMIIPNAKMFFNEQDSKFHKLKKFFFCVFLSCTFLIILMLRDQLMLKTFLYFNMVRRLSASLFPVRTYGLCWPVK